MYTKTFQVVQYLADTLDSYVTSGQLGAHLGVSSRMILRYVKRWEGRMDLKSVLIREGGIK